MFLLRAILYYYVKCRFQEQPYQEYAFYSRKSMQAILKD